MSFKKFNRLKFDRKIKKNNPKNLTNSLHKNKMTVTVHHLIHHRTVKKKKKNNKEKSKKDKRKNVGKENKTDLNKICKLKSKLIWLKKE